MKIIARLKKLMLQKSKPNLIVVCGPTATGKTDLAIKIAKEKNGEVISTDSRQIYRGLDIGTAKVTAQEAQGITHHMIDVADPSIPYSAAQYKEEAQGIIENIHARGKTPILCGGTGMYINAVIYDQAFPNVPPNKKLRDELEKLNLEELQNRLKKIEPRRYSEIDTKNPVRLIRAIEIASELGAVPKTDMQKPIYDIEWHYLDLPDEQLKKRIHARNKIRIKNGLIEEVEGLQNRGLSWERLHDLGLEYRYVSQFLQGKIQSKEKLVDMLDTKTWQFAKRQRTWFKKHIQ
jgi:tRNA dimethylallyltransferase